MATITTSPGQTRALELNILARRQRSLWQDAWYRLRRNRAAMVGLGVVAVFVVISILAPFIAPRDPIQQTTANALADPFWGNPQYRNPDYPLGSDQLGRDILSRLIWSTRVSMWRGFVPVSLIFLIGVSVGMLAGYNGGLGGNLLLRITDVIYAFPDLLFLFIIMAMLRDTAAGNLARGLVLMFVAIG